MIATAEPAKETPAKLPSRKWAITALFLVLLAQLISVYVWPEITGPARLGPQWNYGLGQDPTNGWTIYQMTGLADPPALAHHVEAAFIAPYCIYAQTEDGHYLAGTQYRPAQLFGSMDATRAALVNNQPVSMETILSQRQPPETYLAPHYWITNLRHAAAEWYWRGAVMLAICIYFYRSRRSPLLVNSVSLVSVLAIGADLMIRSGHPVQSLGDGLIILSLTIALLTLRRTGNEPPVAMNDLPQPPMPFGPMPPRAN